jgi:putative sterol carrier protein
VPCDGQRHGLSRGAELQAGACAYRPCKEDVEMADVTVKQIFDEMPTSFNPDAAKGMNAVIQFNLSGDGGGNYHTIIKDGKCSVQEGTHAAPNMTMTIGAQDYVDMITGKLNGQMAFMSGKLKIAGDMGLAMKLQTLFKRPA